MKLFRKKEQPKELALDTYLSKASRVELRDYIKKAQELQDRAEDRAFSLRLLLDEIFRDDRMWATEELAARAKQMDITALTDTLADLEKLLTENQDALGEYLDNVLSSFTTVEIPVVYAPPYILGQEEE